VNIKNVGNYTGVKLHSGLNNMQHDIIKENNVSNGTDKLNLRSDGRWNIPPNTKIVHTDTDSVFFTLDEVAQPEDNSHSQEVFQSLREAEICLQQTRKEDGPQCSNYDITSGALFRKKNYFLVDFVTPVKWLETQQGHIEDLENLLLTPKYNEDLENSLSPPKTMNCNCVCMCNNF
jgi:hypothetical protein